MKHHRERVNCIRRKLQRSVAEKKKKKNAEINRTTEGNAFSDAEIHFVAENGIICSRRYKAVQRKSNTIRKSMAIL